MKKQLLLLVMLLSLAASAFAVEVEIDGLLYDVDTNIKEAKVVEHKNGVKYKGDIVIPDAVDYEGVTCSVTSIGPQAFYSCSRLSSVVIGAGVQRIGIQTFYRCPELTRVTCYAENPPSTQGNVFTSSDIGNIRLYVPPASVDAYKSTAPWSNFKKIIGIGTIAKGDVNCNQAVEVTDVVAIVSYILGEQDNDFDEIFADLNGDGKVDVEDVVETVNIILGE